MSLNSKKIAKLKKKYTKWPPKNGLLINRSLVLNYLPASISIWILRHFLIGSEYKLKRESYKFFALSNSAYSVGKVRQCKRCIRIALSLLDSNFPNSYAFLLLQSIVSTHENSESRKSISRKIIAATKQLEITILDATSWYQLSRGLFCLGYFRAAWVARENSLDLSIAEVSKSSFSATVVTRAIEAQLERRNLDYVRELLVQNTVLGVKTLRSFHESLRWFEGKPANDSEVHVTIKEYSGHLFRELVERKKVALVGPGNAHYEYGVEIDSADAVARIKYPGAEYLLDEKLFGKRCDISQYPSLEPLRELANLSSYEYFDDLRLIVAGGTDSRPVRNIPVFCEDQELPMYRTTATSGLRLLISILRQCPSSLKIFGYDFYSEREPYNVGMKSFYENNAWRMGIGFLFGTKEEYQRVDITSSFGAHDPVSNFCFAQNLYKAGLFEIEPYGKSILELTPYQYVERLEEMLGDW
ncbi:MAG: hypothetical protein WCH63_05140 [Actinomycetota bacterium]